MSDYALLIRPTGLLCGLKRFMPGPGYSPAGFSEGTNLAPPNTGREARHQRDKRTCSFQDSLRSCVWTLQRRVSEARLGNKLDLSPSLVRAEGDDVRAGIRLDFSAIWSAFGALRGCHECFAFLVEWQ